MMALQVIGSQFLGRFFFPESCLGGKGGGQEPIHGTDTDTPLKFNSSFLKNDGWKKLSFWDGLIFRGYVKLWRCTCPTEREGKLGKSSTRKRVLERDYVSSHGV